MKILYVMMKNEVCGGNRIIYEQTNRLTKRGHEVHIWYCKEMSNYHWHKVDATEIVNPKKVNDDYDLVVITYFETYFSYKNLSQLNNIPVAYLVQGREPYFVKDSAWKHRVEVTYANKNINFITISKQLQSWLMIDYGIEAQCVPNGLDLNIFKPTESTIVETSKKPIILIEGSFNFWLKGIADSLSVLFDLRKSGREFEIWYMTKDTGKIFGIDRQYISPPQEYIPEIYSTADILIKASYMEGSPLPHMEAMACGTLLVTSDCVGTEEYCKHDHNCYVFETGNKAEMTTAIEHALDTYKDDVIQKNARKYAQENFEWKEKIDKLESIFERIVNTNNRRTQ